MMLLFLKGWDNLMVVNSIQFIHCGGMRETNYPGPRPSNSVASCNPEGNQFDTAHLAIHLENTTRALRSHRTDRQSQRGAKVDSMALVPIVLAGMKCYGMGWLGG